MFFIVTLLVMRCHVADVSFRCRRRFFWGGGFACVGLLSSFEAMTNLDKSPAKKPPQKVPAWDGRDAVLAGAILDCSFNLGSTAQGNPTL